MCIFMFDRYIPRMIRQGIILILKIFEEANAKDQTPTGAGASTPETGHQRSTALMDLDPTPKQKLIRLDTGMIKALARLRAWFSTHPIMRRFRAY